MFFSREVHKSAGDSVALPPPRLASKRPSLNKNNIQKHLFLTRQQLQFCLFSESTFPLWILRVMKGSTGHVPGFTSVPDRLSPDTPLRTFSPSQSLSFSNSFLSLVSQSSHRYSLPSHWLTLFPYLFRQHRIPSDLVPRSGPDPVTTRSRKYFDVLQD